MKTVKVFNTHATASKGKIMHVDVLITEQNTDLALNYARQWLQSISGVDSSLTSKKWVFCHSD